MRAEPAIVQKPIMASNTRKAMQSQMSCNYATLPMLGRQNRDRHILSELNYYRATSQITMFDGPPLINEQNCSRPLLKQRSQPLVITRKLRPRVETIGQRVASSMCFSIVLEYLRQVDSIHLQQLNRYFYHIQLSRCQMTLQVASKAARLHLLNANYIVTFDLLRLTKSKRLIKNEGF